MGGPDCARLSRSVASRLDSTDKPALVSQEWNIIEEVAAKLPRVKSPPGRSYTSRITPLSGFCAKTLESARSSTR